MGQNFDNITSALGKKWQVSEPNNQQIAVLKRELELPEIVASLLTARNITLENAPNFLDPKLRSFLPDPSHLLDMDKAVERIISAIEKHETITIWGDYDVDGATSTALLIRYFRMISLEAGHYIPDRMKEGYGPNISGMQQLAAQGTNLVITVDCGAVSFEPIEAANDAGMDVIVMDHHLGAEKLPKAVAVVNPNRLDETTEHKNLAAVGVCFLLIIAINRALKASGKATSNEQIFSLLDVVALGTVCDVMKLTGLNRAFVSQGLKILANKQNIGLKALSEAAGSNNIPDVFQLGFALGPRINAGGRIGKSELGTRLLISENYEEAWQISADLNKLNEERRAIEAETLEQAIAQIDKTTEKPPFLIASSENWHQGIIGIVASRIKDKFRQPAAVISWEDNVGKASARSISNVDIGSIIVAAKQAGLLEAGGGHAMAGGFTIMRDKFNEFHQFVNHRIKDNVAEYLTKNILKCDGVLPISAITVDLWKSLQMLAPYGVGNPEPKLIFGPAHVTYQTLLKEQHLKFDIIAGGAAMASSARVKCIAFRAIETPIYKAIAQHDNRDVYIAGKISLNRWNGNESAEIIVDDVVII